MGFFITKKRGNDLQQLNHVLKTSFKSVKEDIFKISGWLDYLHQKNIQQEKTLNQLQRKIHHLPQSAEELRDLIETHYALKVEHKLEKLNHKVEIFEDSHKEVMTLKYQIHELKSRLDTLNTSPEQIENINSRIDHIKDRIRDVEDTSAPLKKHIEEHATVQTYPQQPVQKTVQTARENLIRKIAKSSKNHVKTIIRSLIIKYGQIAALQLREIIVEEQGLCSKSSFYRILEEIEEDEDISVVRDKKEKKYHYNTLKVS
jgi:hypothetical protein